MMPDLRITAFLFLLLMLSGCGGEEEKHASGNIPMPDSLISRQNMILILADVHVAEAAIQVQRNEGKDTVGNAAFFYQSIFKKHHVTRHQYDESLTFYIQHPELFSKMYDDVIKILEDRRKFIQPPR